MRNRVMFPCNAMVPEQSLFILRLTVYFIVWALSFVCWIPLCIVLDRNRGYCLLYASRAYYGSVATCGYTITVPIIFSTLYAGYMAVSYIFKLCVFNRQGYTQETFVEFLVTVIMDGLAWIFMFVNACLISAGFNFMCWNIFGTIAKCREGVLKHSVFGTYDLFFQHLKIAEVAAWLCWLLLLSQLIMGIIALWRSGMLNPRSDNVCCGIFPCRPHCTCSCKLHFQSPQQRNIVPGQQSASGPQNNVRRG